MSQPAPIFTHEFLDPKRQPTETQAEYKARRKLAQRAVEVYQQRGVVRHLSSTSMQLPAAGADPALDERIKNGQIRHVQKAISQGKVIRIGTSKGVTFRKTGRG